VARKRREHDRPESGVPTSVPSVAEEGNVLVMIGIDPYKATHTPVAIDDDENVIDEFTLRASKKRIAQAVAASSTWLTSTTGIGPICAATIIGCTKDVTRCPTRGHYATYNATAPIEVSSAGHTRHRLNLRGNRILNHAIHITAVTQLRHDPRGRAYDNKKIAEGRTSKEALRALKRRITDAVYRRLIADAHPVATTSQKAGLGGQPGTSL
jgi:transposase